MRCFPVLAKTFACALGLSLATSTWAQSPERTVKIYGFGAKSGVVRVF